MKVKVLENAKVNIGVAGEYQCQSQKSKVKGH